MRKHIRRRRLSLTSLIDVIFLLLLFFMLSSTFSKFSEVELAAASAGAAGTSDVQRSFLQLGEDTLSLNGEDIAPEALADRFGQTAPDAEAISVIISMQDGVTAQRLTDILAVLRGIDRLKINVLGS